MNWADIGSGAVGAVVGSGLTGIGAYIGLGRIIEKVKTEMDALKTSCTSCRQDTRSDITALRSSINDHHENGPHINTAYRELLDRRLIDIVERLISIEEYLRNGKRS